MDYLDLVLPNSRLSQVNDPKISQTRRDHENAQTIWRRQMAFVEVESTTFLVRKKGFNQETFFVPMTGFIG